MSKNIKLSEEKWHECSTIGTLVGVFTFSNSISNEVDSWTGGGERTTYVLEVDGQRQEFSSENARDQAAKKSI